MQHTKSIPTILNRYAILHNLQDDTEFPQLQGQTSKIEYINPKNKRFSYRKKKKIVIIGDSHARGCAAEVSNCMGKSFEVTGTVIPGARNEAITHLDDKEITNLSKDDVVVVWGGTKDISKNESNIGLKHIKKFALNLKHTNVIVTTAPLRYDLHTSSCINKET